MGLRFPVLMHRQAGPVPSPALFHDPEHIIHNVLCSLYFFSPFLLKHVSEDTHSSLVSLSGPVISSASHINDPRNSCALHPDTPSPRKTCSPGRGLQGRLPSPGATPPSPAGGLPLLTALLSAPRPPPFQPPQPAGAAGVWGTLSTPPSSRGHSLQSRHPYIWCCSCLQKGVCAL